MLNSWGVGVSVPLAMKTWGSTRLLKLRPFFSKDCTFDRADLEADAAIDAGVEIDPIKVGSLFVLALALVDAGHWTGINAIGNAFAHISDDGVSHGWLGSTGRILGIDPVELETLALRQLLSLLTVLQGMELKHGAATLRVPVTLLCQTLFEAGAL